MYQLSDIGVIEELLSRHGFHLSHKLGQNFLINPSVCPKMAAECGAGKEVCALEIGPGIGVLTKELAKVAKKVVAIEPEMRSKWIFTEYFGSFFPGSVSLSAQIFRIILRLRY